VARFRLTDTTVKKLPAPEKGNRIYYDALVDGFGLRVTKNDVRAFVLNYRTRADRQERRFTIGSIENWLTTIARKEAKRLKQSIDVGGDPLAEIEAERGAPTIENLVDIYVERHLPKKKLRSRIEDERLLPIILAEFRRVKVDDVSFAMVHTLHQKMTKERGPFRANRVVALLSKMFSLAIKWGMRPKRDNPCIGIERNYEPKRNRYLTDAELPRLMAALDAEVDQQAADIVRLLLLTGARSAEALGATWDQFDLEAGVWTKPYTMTKQGEEHRLPLSEEATALLTRLKARSKSKFVFPGANPFEHRRSIRHPWDRLRKVAELGDMRIHDVRHSHASLLANAGYSLPTIGALLGHKTPSTTQRYVHLVDGTLREAAKSVGAMVIPIRGKAQ
jgi:integrase